MEGFLTGDDSGFEESDTDIPETHPAEAANDVDAPAEAANDLDAVDTAADHDGRESPPATVAPAADTAMPTTPSAGHVVRY